MAAHELWHGGRFSWGNAAALQDSQQRHHENPQIKREAAVVHIPEIAGEALFPLSGVAAVHLCPSGDPREYTVAARLLWRISIQIFHQQWARTDKTHVAEEHIP